MASADRPSGRLLRALTVIVLLAGALVAMTLILLNGAPSDPCAKEIACGPDPSYPSFFLGLGLAVLDVIGWMIFNGHQRRPRRNRRARAGPFGVRRGDR